MPIERSSKRALLALLAVALVSLLLDLAFGAFRIVRPDGGDAAADASVSLPTPRDEGDVSVEEAVANRRSRREYGDRPLELRELAQLCWATQGETDRRGHRAAPSAGALYPLELYVVVGTPGVDDLDPGVYRYRPANHDLTRERTGDLQSQLRDAAVDQDHVGAAAVDVVLTAVDERTTGKYGERGSARYVPMEAGHAGENLYLQAESLGLSTVAVGAFNDGRVREIVGAPATHRPLYVFPVGARA
jgi:SagB-type dehydrogenase family enzyme